MDEQPDIVSSGPPWRPGVRWPGPGGSFSVAAVAIGPRPGSVPLTWLLVYRWQDGVPLGGIQGPLTGPGARIFRSAAPC